MRSSLVRQATSGERFFLEVPELVDVRQTQVLGRIVSVLVTPEARREPEAGANPPQMGTDGSEHTATNNDDVLDVPQLERPIQ